MITERKVGEYTLRHSIVTITEDNFYKYSCTITKGNTTLFIHKSKMSYDIALALLNGESEKDIQAALELLLFNTEFFYKNLKQILK